MNVYTKLFIASAFCVFSGMAQAQNVHGVLRVVKGDVQIKSAKDGSLSKARIGAQVFPKDTVITGKDARAKIVMVDNNEINVSPESQIEIQHYEYDPNAGKKDVLLNVIYGKVRSKVEQKYDGKTTKFQIKTPGAVAGVRGTDFVTSFDRGSRQSQITTFHGRVEFGTPGPGGTISNPVFVTPGTQATSTGGAAPTPPAPVPKEQLAKMDNETKADTAQGKTDAGQGERQPAGDDKKDKDKDKKDDGAKKDDAGKSDKKDDGKKADSGGDKKDAGAKDDGKKADNGGGAKDDGKKADNSSSSKDDGKKSEGGTKSAGSSAAKSAGGAVAGKADGGSSGSGGPAAPGGEGGRAPASAGASSVGAPPPPAAGGPAMGPGPSGPPAGGSMFRPEDFAGGPNAPVLPNLGPAAQTPVYIPPAPTVSVAPDSCGQTCRDAVTGTKSNVKITVIQH